MNGDELVKQESVTKKSRKVSVTKITHGSENPPNVKKQIKKKDFQTQHSPALSFHEFHLYL